MRWYRNLYMGPNAALYVEKVRKRAAQGKMMPGIYYLTLPTVPGNLDVIGIAEGKQEAFRLTAQIMEEVLQKTGGFDVEAFFREEDFQSNEGIQER